jgi:TIR domain-containing protein
MGESALAAPGRIFISYRREETAYPAGWLFDRLAKRFGGDQVFKDVDSIQLGDDFVEVITRAVGSCDVLLALIGPRWLTIADEQGRRRRLDNPEDFVRLEIEAALTRRVRVVPILVDGARMPRVDELPGSLALLVRRQALELSPARFDFDLGRLLRVLDRTLAEGPGPAAGGPAARWVEPWPPPPSPEADSMAGEPEPDGGVSFTAGYPGVVTPQLGYSLSLQIQLGRPQAQVAPLPQGTRLLVCPEVPGVVFDPPVREVRWQQDLRQVTFQLEALAHAAGRVVLGAVEVRAGPLLVAQVPLSISVRVARQRQERTEATDASTARLFGSVFASYGPEDDHVVALFAEAYRALGIDMLMDAGSRAEEGRRARSQLIEEADVFLLFWSKAASRSPRVAEEWQQALSLQDRKGGRFIRPLYWSLPWPRPPARLRHLHFAPFDLALLSEVAAR